MSNGRGNRLAVPPGAYRAAAEAVGEELLPAINPFFGLLPPALWHRAKDFFIYATDFAGATVLPASGTASTQIQIQNDSHFLIMAGVRVVTDTANTAFVADAPELVRITDSGSGRELSNIPVHIENWFGTAQLPAYWPFPKIIKRASTLTTEITNLEATARNVRLAYMGFKIFTWNFQYDWAGGDK